MGAASAMMRCRPGEYACPPRGYEKEVLPYPLGTVTYRCGQMPDGSRQTPLLVTSPPCAWLGAGRKALVADGETYEEPFDVDGKQLAAFQLP